PCFIPAGSFSRVPTWHASLPRLRAAPQARPRLEAVSDGGSLSLPGQPEVYSGPPPKRKGGCFDSFTLAQKAFCPRAQSVYRASEDEAGSGTTGVEGTDQ